MPGISGSDTTREGYGFHEALELTSRLLASTTRAGIRTFSSEIDEALYLPHLAICRLSRGSQATFSIYDFLCESISSYVVILLG